MATPDDIRRQTQRLANLAKRIEDLTGPKEPPQPDAPNIVTTRKQVAAHFGKSLDTIKDWREKGMPGSPGHYDLAEILRWRDANVGPSGRNENGDACRAEAERRRAWAEAEIKEAKAAKLRGETAGIDEIARLFRHVANHARAVFEQLPQQTLGMLPAIGQPVTADDLRRIRAGVEKGVDTGFSLLHGELLRWAVEAERQAEEAARRAEAEREGRVVVIAGGRQKRKNGQKAGRKPRKPKG